MACRGEETSSDDSGPEAVAAGKELGGPGEAKIEHLEFMRGAGKEIDVRPAAWNLREDNRKAEDGTTHVEEHLDHVGPDHGGQAAFECIKQGCADDHGDRDDLAGAEYD